ncbi:hypothetical protein Glove_60g112 [Diversispora epigaea]|uniref:Protein kinase domain-containing protein n=1 Tax=Diversispora epigaea TaxID=1348612 RepID=A0A397JF51_9GLOM|nr:hypothetical protein Glove_60g112 [Diversispora epigaea]
MCLECNQKYSGYEWCKTCNSKHFQNDFNSWAGGNDKIDKLIQDAQLNANDNLEVIESIDLKIWIDGYIGEWDIENQQWKRYPKDKEGAASIRFYGITQDPETHSYMMVLEYAKDGNLREYLKINNINRNQKLYKLWNLSLKLVD